MCRELKEMGIQVVVSVWPTVDIYSENFEEMKEKGYLVRTEHGVPLTMLCGGNEVFFDATNPDARTYVWEKIKKKTAMGRRTGVGITAEERLRYVFDVSDTGTRPNSRSLNLWELREEHIPAVSSMLEKNYGVPAGENLADQLETVASQLAREYWEDNRRDILGILEDSFLEEYDEFNVGVAFRNAAEVSISYSLMLRCGLEPENYFEHEDFMSVFDFNTPETAGALGTAPFCLCTL